MHLTNFRLSDVELQQHDIIMYFLYDAHLEIYFCLFYSINKSNGVAVQLKYKASTVLQQVQDSFKLPPLWPYVVECCASTVRALLPQVRLSFRARADGGP